MAKWEESEIFVAVVKYGGFSSAAEKLGVSKSHVSRQISQLENRLGAQLLQRTTRKVTTTEVGQAYYLRAKELVEGLEDAEKAVMDLQATPRGNLKMTVAGGFGEDFVAPAAAEFMAHNPELNIEIDFTNRTVDLIAEGYDLAIRAGVLRDSTLIARRIVSRPMCICASPEYLARKGEPVSVEGLSRHDCLLGTLSTWRFRSSAGHSEQRLEGRWRSNNGRALLSAARQGLGLVQLPEFYVRKDLAEGTLVEVLKDVQPTDTGVWAVYPSNRHLSAKVRLFVEFLVTYCREHNA
jgi:DNA-binding transcriptional LysR family regulator